MPEGETLPKSKKSKDWLAAADEKLGELKQYAGKRRVFGLQGKPTPSDTLYKALSDKELQLRSQGMKFKREEVARGEYKKGGKARRTGPAKLHEGEMVMRKKPRKASRSSSR